MMKMLIRSIAAATLLGALALPASAAENYVFDGAGLLSSATVSSLNTTIDALHTSTGKEVVVDIVSSTNGDTPQAVAEREFASHNVNGVMIFISKKPKSIGVIPDRAARAIFPSGMTSTIRSAIRSGFRSGDYDGAVTDGVNLVVDTYRSHEGALRREPARRNAVPATRQAFVEDRGGHLNWFWIIIIAVAGFILVRAIMRAVSGPRYYPPSGYGPGAPPGPGYGGGPGPGYGGPGYGGGGFGGGGGGGGFFSSLLGGLGGAFLGNELFNSFNRPQGVEPVQTYDANTAGFDEGGASRPESYDAGAFQNDAGQADMGNASFGDWGGDGGGSGDSGGGGGGDSGGGDNSGW